MSVRRAAALVAGCLGLIATACGSGVEHQQADSLDATDSTTTATTVEPSTATGAEAQHPDAGLIDTQEILDRHGFVVCDGIPPVGEVPPGRGVEIIHAAVDAGIASGGGAGGDGYLPSVSLFVLDDPSLSALAEIADPSEACINGQDPNDYVAPGPQALEGPGWRWIGAGGLHLESQLSLIMSEAEYDELWPHLGEGPEQEQASVDFDREVILAITHGSGVNFGPCGHRFDGFAMEDQVVVLDWFSPGGYTSCETPLIYTTYAVALDRAVVGSPPLTVAYRYGPREPGRDQQVVTAGSFAVATTVPPREAEHPDPTTTVEATVPPTASTVAAEAAPGVASSPRWSERAGPGSAGRFDIPVPPEWEAISGPDSARSAIVGRGELVVESYSVDDPQWKSRVNPRSDMEVAAGPAALAVPTYEFDDDALVTTGRTLVAHEYRFTSSGVSFLRQIVRWYERGDTVTVAMLSYPDPDKVPQALTGLDPEQLLNDIRLIE